MRKLWAQLVMLATLWCAAVEIVIRPVRPVWRVFNTLTQKLLRYHEWLEIGIRILDPNYMTILREIDYADPLTATELSDIVGCLLEKVIEHQHWSREYAIEVITNRTMHEGAK